MNQDTHSPTFSPDEPDWLTDLISRHPGLDARALHHFANPGVSWRNYVQNHKQRLARIADERVTIYLDVKEWIYCRDAAMGKPQCPSHSELWGLLLSAVREGRAVCPFSLPIWSELRKQGDWDKAEATAAIVDQLSGGLALEPPPTLLELEIENLLYKRTIPGASVPTPHIDAWTIPLHALGLPFLELPDLPLHFCEAVRKSVFDVNCAAGFQDAVRAMRRSGEPPYKEPLALYEEWNREAIQFGTAGGFREVFMEEVRGWLRAFEPAISNVVAIVGRDLTGVDLSVPEAAMRLKQATRLVSAMIHGGYRLKEWSKEVPHLHIGAGLRAMKRCAKCRFVEGDIWDELHAYCALTYCDVFLTERRLAHFLRERPLELGATYECDVAGTTEEAVKLLRRLSANG